MCLTIRPGEGAHFFSFLQVRHFWKTPTGNTHPDLIVGYLLTAQHRSRGSKCA